MEKYIQYRLHAQSYELLGCPSIWFSQQHPHIYDIIFFITVMGAVTCRGATSGQGDHRMSASARGTTARDHTHLIEYRQYVAPNLKIPGTLNDYFCSH